MEAQDELNTLTQQVIAKAKQLDIVYCSAWPQKYDSGTKLSQCIIEQRIGVLKDLMTAMNAIEKSIKERGEEI